MSWMPILPRNKGPIFLALADSMAEAIRTGALSAGDRLPSQRELAQALGVDLTTITRGYAEAARRGLIRSEGRRGSFVRGGAPAAGPTGPREEAASGMNMPPEPEDGTIRDTIAAGLAGVIGSGHASLQYQPSGGGEADRAAAALYLAKLIPDTSPDQMVVTAGAQNGLHAVCGILLGQGARAAAGCFAYPGFIALARRFGAELAPLAMDDQGIRPDSFEREAARKPLAALYVVPTNDNPTTATMGPVRRREIAEIARRHGIPIIEDDPYGRLAENPAAPLASLAPELTWHVTSVSKLISPSLRVGFVRAPDIRGAARLAGDIHETAVMAPPFNLALVTQWIGDGTFPRLVGAVRAEAGARMRAALPLLKSGALHHQPEGYHLWLELDGGLSAADLSVQALAAGLPVAPGASFCVGGDAPLQALRISLGGSRSRETVVRDLRRLDALIAQAMRGGHIFV
jgi:DNA-binding transcriptional MocR family regulator